MGFPKNSKNLGKHMGFQKKLQKPVKKHWFPQKTAETCKNTLVSPKKRQKPVQTHGFPKKLAETCKNIWVSQKTSRNL